MLLAAALGTLDGTDLQQVLAHAEECPECGPQLENYRDVTVALAQLLPSRKMDPVRSARLRSRLQARVRGQDRGEAADPVRAAAASTPGSAVSVASRWAGWTVAAAIAGVLLVHHAVHQTLDYGWLAAGAMTLALIAVAVYARVQRARVSALQARLAAFEPRTRD